MIKQAVVLSGGKGTRMRPYTYCVPKQMISLLNKPVIEYVVEELIKAEVANIVIVVDQSDTLIENHFDRNEKYTIKRASDGKTIKKGQITDSWLTFVKQDKPRGTAHAIGLCQERLKGDPFVVAMGDSVICDRSHANPSGLQQLMEAFANTGNTTIAVQHEMPESICKYGIADYQDISSPFKARRVSRFVEKPKDISEAPSSDAIAGRYIFTNTIFNYIDGLKQNKKGEFCIADAINLMAASKQPVFAFRWDAKRYDIGCQESYIKCFFDTAFDAHSKVIDEMLAVRRDELRAIMPV